MTSPNCGALPEDVPAEVLPLLVSAQWRTTAAAAGYRCQCAGTCGRSHRKDGGRCAKTLRGPAAERLFAVPAAPGSADGRCADGRRTAERRQEAGAAAARLDEAPSLFDLPTPAGD